MSWSPSLVRSVASDGRLRVQLGHEVVDDFLEFAAGRCRPNTVLAAGFDLKTFFSVVERDPVEVVTADVLAFIRAQRGARNGTVVRLAEGGSGLSSRTIARRLAVEPKSEGGGAR